MYESPIKIITGQIKTNNVDREELLKALEYDRWQYEEGFREGEKHTMRQIKDLLPEWLYAAIKENLIKAGEQE